MIEIDKQYTDNPFVDNLIYYSKLLALNSVVKDQDEVLANETTESLKAGDIYIACIEGTSNYEMFSNIPKEILEKYIQQTSNLDLYVNNPSALFAHIESLSIHEQTILKNKLSNLARTVYIDHYDIMLNYIQEVGPSWINDNKSLYDRCCNGIATWEDLYDIMPLYTRRRIIKCYLNNYDNSELNGLVSNISKFREYVEKRSDDSINTELDNISSAMRDVFKSHFDIVIQRGYFKQTNENNWYDYTMFSEVYDKCVNDTATYKVLFDLFPKDDLNDILQRYISISDINAYDLLSSSDNLQYYLTTHSTIIDNINTDMRKMYIDNYNVCVNFDIYNKCKAELLGYFDLIKYLPFETQKMILAQCIDECTNLDVYASNKTMLNSYLSTLGRVKSQEIKNNINIDMRKYYIDNFVETNNYYRTFLGLPPMKDGYVYEDTLFSTYDEKTGNIIYFDDDLVKELDSLNIYPVGYWKSNIYEFDSYDVGILNEYDIINRYLEKCNSNIQSERYKYLRFIGDSRLDIYTCRRASEFDLISVPSIDDTELRNNFINIYNINRDYVITSVFSDAYKFQSDYYNKFIIIFIMVNTIMDLLAKIPDFIINRDVFDSRCIKYLFESYGIPFYSEIPIKYQQRMLKNLNILIKFKSSTKNMVDICSLFGFSDVKVFGYYLMKERIVDSNSGEYSFDENNDIYYDPKKLYVPDDKCLESECIKDYNGVKYIQLEKYRNYNKDIYFKSIKTKDDKGNITENLIVNREYRNKVYLKEHIKQTIDGKNDEFDMFIPLSDSDYFKKIDADITPAERLKFIKVPVNESFAEYKNDPDYIVNYDEIVEDIWDGGLDHKYLQQEILDYEFNAVKSKYISVETVTEMTELAFQVSYFYNMLFDNMYSEDKLLVEIPFIKQNHKFKFMDVVCYLFSLMYLYNGLNDNIMYSPTQILYVKGYNFNSDLNKILEDPNIFSQLQPGDKPWEQKNIFDINDRIDEDGYDYHKAFENYDMKAFNLNVDIDELENWLVKNYQMSLDDFIVDDTLTNFDHIVTMRQFYSLNNSYYQKNIFKNNLLPTQYNQELKYGFGVELYSKQFIADLNNTIHEYVSEIEDGESYLMEVINNKNDSIFIMDYNRFITKNMVNYTLYKLYNKTSTNDYTLDSNSYYIINENNKYEKVVNKSINIINKNNDYIFSSDAYYKKNSNDEYIEITDPKYFYPDPINESCKILDFGVYYVYLNGKYVLDPDNCYVIVNNNGVLEYVLEKDASNHQTTTVPIEDCYIRHDDGHFIKLVDTDYYRVIKDNSSDEKILEYNVEECYIITNEKTEYFDKSANPRVYYKKIALDKYDIYSTEKFVKDKNGVYISENELISPNNCYYKYDNNTYLLVINNIYEYKNYKTPLNVKYNLILHNDNDYNRCLRDTNYINTPSAIRRYIKDSDNNFVLTILYDKTYDETNYMIVVFNKDLTYALEDEELGIFDAEVSDGVWDENDWFYPYPNEEYKETEFGMYGENKWYYKDPKGIISHEDDNDKSEVGSGFYLNASTYLGNIALEKGTKYYMAFDIETNFNGRIQISCDSDSECINNTCRIYTVTSNIIQHVEQVFICNDVKYPRLKFIIYDYKNYPIENGDYIIVKNIKFVKAYSNNYIPQDIPSYDKLQELYKTNEAIYKYLVTLMQNCTDYDTYQIYKKLYTSLMTSKYNKEAFKLSNGEYAKTYTDFLQTRDSVLYNKLVYFKSLDEDTMHKQIADNIIEVTYAIDDCVNTYSYGYLYSYFPAVSANYIQQYISKIINFFKSWKVHLIGINTIYKFDDGLENTIKILEDQEYRVKFDNQKQKVYIADDVKINPLDATNISGKKYSELYPDLVDFSHKYTDKVIIRDKIEMITSDGNYIKFTDNGEILHVVTDNPKTIVKDVNGNMVTNEAGFRVANTNELLLHLDDNYECSSSGILLNSDMSENVKNYIDLEDDK